MDLTRDMAELEWKVRMETIQWLILAEGAISGLFSIPWIYLVSTLTIRFRTLTRKDFVYM